MKQNKHSALMPPLISGCRRLVPGRWQDVSVLGLEDLLLEEVLLV